MSMPRVPGLGYSLCWAYSDKNWTFWFYIGLLTSATFAFSLRACWDPDVSKWALLVGHPWPSAFWRIPFLCLWTCSSAVHRVGFFPSLFRVSSWIVIAAHRRKMYLVGRSPGHSLLAGRLFLVYGPLDVRCKAKKLHCKSTPRYCPRFRARPSVWSVLDTVGRQSLHLFTYYDGSPGPPSSTPSCSLAT